MEPTDEEYVNHAIIKPPDNFPNLETNKRNTRFVVDSRNRDIKLFPSPAQYEIIFDDDIDDVLSAKLVCADIPFSTYLINMYFNTLYMTMNGTSYKVVLDRGDYTPQQLAAAIENAINNLVTADDFTVTYTSSTDKFSIAAKYEFSINFDVPNSLCYLLGFSKKLYTSATVGTLPYTHVLSADFRRNFNYCNYIVMSLEQFDANKSVYNLLSKSFAIIPRKYTDLNISDKSQIIKNFSPSIPRLNKLRVKFYDPYGNLYDFQNHDHRYEIVFTSFKQKRRYQQIFVNR